MAKLIEFVGSALDDLRAFPLAARREAGYQLDRVQSGHDPDDWKPMSTVKLADAVYVLHCFQKKTQKASSTDLELAAKRYRELLKEQGP